MFDLICFIIGIIMIAIFILSTLLWLLLYLPYKIQPIITLIALIIGFLLLIASFSIGVLMALAYK